MGVRLSLLTTSPSALAAAGASSSTLEDGSSSVCI